MIILLYQILNVKPGQADTYKCFATNEYGQAACTVTLNVIEGKRDIITIPYVHCKLIKLKNNVLEL